MSVSWSILLLSIFLRDGSASITDKWSFIPEGHHCRSQVVGWLEKNRASGNWRRQVDPAPGAKSYRFPTTEFGVWMEAHISSVGEVEVYRLSPQGSESFRWNQDCREQNVLKAKSKPSTGGFTDADLARLLKENKKGMIYIWSPGMVYSMDFYPNFKNTAERLKLPLTVLMDPYFDEEQGARRAKEFKFPFMNQRVESVELLMRDVGTHYPETLIYSDGKLSKQRIVGVLTADVLESEVKASLRALKEGRDEY